MDLKPIGAENGIIELISAAWILRLRPIFSPRVCVCVCGHAHACTRVYVSVTAITELPR